VNASQFAGNASRDLHVTAATLTCVSCLGGGCEVFREPSAAVRAVASGTPRVKRTRMRSLSVALICLLFASPAFAEDDEDRSPSVAVGLSLGVTTAGVVTLIASDRPTTTWLGLGALYLGPSTGQWYAGEYGGLGLAARGLGGVAAIYGLSLLLQSEDHCEPELDGNCSDPAVGLATTGKVLMLAGAGLWVGSSIADVVFAKRAADRWNARRAVTIAPTAIGPGHAPGIVVGGTF
jgi:hypothetical protein